MQARPSRRYAKTQRADVAAPWSPDDELPSLFDTFLHKRVEWQGPLPTTGPRDWRMTIVWLQALGKVQREGLRLRVAKGHEDVWPAKRGRGQRLYR